MNAGSDALDSPVYELETVYDLETKMSNILNIFKRFIKAIDS